MKKVIAPVPVAMPLSFVAKRKQRLDENGKVITKKKRTKEVRKTKPKPKHIHSSAKQSVEYEPIRKEHSKARRPKKLTDRQVRKIFASKDRAIPNLIAMGHEFDMITGLWKPAPEFGV